MSLLPVITPEAVRRKRRSPVSPKVLAEAAAIVESVREGGEGALRNYTEKYGDRTASDPLVLDRDDLERALTMVDEAVIEVLERTAGRIEGFAHAQLDVLGSVDVAVEGGRAGNSLRPVRSVGAYAPGGRHPLPSSVLMTVVPARVAGCETVWVASPRPAPVTLAAAAVAGADGLLCAGGAHAIAALAFGTVTPACDLVVGPGNAWVTAAKKYLVGEVGIDGLAGPSEILVVADASADPAVVAADLLAQAEHDTLAEPMLISTDPGLVEEVQAELAAQLVDLPTSEVAREALGRGFATVVASLAEAVALSDRLAPEHLALHVDNPEPLAGEFTSYGSLFVGAGSAESLADYGVGPNHVLPTGGGARFQSGLSVYTFVRTPTWLRIDAPAPTAPDAAMLARLEGLEAHARAAERRSETVL